MTIEIVPVEGLPEVRPGDDLVELLAPALDGLEARGGDVIAVTQKIVSKAEGRLVPADERQRWIERESDGVVARRGELVIARTRHGFVCANAGVDASNVPTGVLSLLPEDPDASAERLRVGLEARLASSPLAVVVTDTFGRPWREGVVDVAIGCAGLAPLVDLRGTVDDRGRSLETTVVALADAVAAAGGLVMTKTARVPAALVRGVELTPAGATTGPARALVRAPADDLFRESALTAVGSAVPTTSFGTDAVDLDAVEDAVTAATPGDDDVRFATVTSRAGLTRLASVTTDRSSTTAVAAIVVLVTSASEPDATLRAGAAIGRLTVALRGRDVGWRWGPGPIEAAGVADALDLEGHAAAVLWLGAPGGRGLTARPPPPSTPRPARLEGNRRGRLR